MRLVRLTPGIELHAFDCGDEDLNNFLVEDARHFQNKRIAFTFLLVDKQKIVAYFCLLNDKISRIEVTNSNWRRIKDTFPDNKRFGSYPSIKIGRFAVSQDYKGKSIGTDLINVIKDMLLNQPAFSAFRYITVDAYISEVDFYKKNNFKELTEKVQNDHTRLMYFDMLELMSEVME